MLQPPTPCAPLAVFVIAAILDISSNVSASSSPVTAEHSAYRSQRNSCAMRYVYLCQLFTLITDNRRKGKVYLLRINNILILNPEIPLKTQHHNRYLLAVTMLEVSRYFISPLHHISIIQHHSPSPFLRAVLTSFNPSNDPRSEISNARTTTSGRSIVQCWFGLAVS